MRSAWNATNASNCDADAIDTVDADAASAVTAMRCVGVALNLFLDRIEKVVSVTNLILKDLKLYTLVTTRSRTIVVVEFCTQI